MSEQIRALPRPGETWKHHNGNAYQILAVANLAAIDHYKFPVTVVYGDKEYTWSRPADVFVRKFSRVS